MEPREPGEISSCGIHVARNLLKFRHGILRWRGTDGQGEVVEGGGHQCGGGTMRGEQGVWVYGSKGGGGE